ncbi:MAG: D-2-hydroxyacid dehydrogenase [Clostridia bacterium]|nr:D-2-hydroxyacid dehydrogenase [Clostridia bacterium]
MKIIILDKCTVTKGDVDLSPLERFGEVEYYDLLTKEEIKRVLVGADAVVCNKAKIDREIIEASTLKFIGVFATGYNNIDTVAARERGIAVCNVPGYSTDSVAQLTVSLMLELAGNASAYARSVAAGDWKRSRQFSYFFAPITEIKGKTLGIYGLGTIGKAVAKVALAFGMKVIAYSRTPKNLDGIRDVDRETLFRESDFLSFHCPLNAESALAVNQQTLSLMKPTAFLINTARGGIIDEVALAEALEKGQIAGAALDVLTEEPMSENCVLFGAKNCIITPHIAWAAYETRVRLIDLVAKNLEAFIDGTPINVVN